MEDITKVENASKSPEHGVNVIGEKLTEPSGVSGVAQNMDNALKLWWTVAQSNLQAILFNGLNGGVKQSIGNNSVDDGNNNFGNRPNLVDDGKKPGANQVSERSLVACDQCPRTYHFESNLYRHKREAHGFHGSNIKNKKVYKCERCPREYVRLKYFKDHIAECKAVKDGKKQTKKCPFCEREFFSQSGFYSHQKKHTAPGSSE